MSRVLTELSIEGEDLDLVASAVVDFGGVDTEQLQTGDVLAGYLDADSAPWHELGFAMLELYAQYSVVDQKNWTAQMAAGWALTVLVSCHAARCGVVELELSVDSLFECALGCRRLLSEEARAAIVDFAIAHMDTN